MKPGFGTVGHVQRLELPDRRQFAWREYGQPDGLPCIYVTGTPASGRAGEVYDKAALEAGIRWIAVDKPGYGMSDFQPGRTLRSFAADIAALADSLGLARFAVAGESGGGPHALALAHEMPERLTVALVLAGMGPGEERWVRDGMKPMNKVLFGIAQGAPWALRAPLALMGWMLRDDKRCERFEKSQLRVAPSADRELLAAVDATPIREAAREAFRQGSRGAAQEMALMARPWGFDLRDIACPVVLWHGTEDVNVPVRVARQVAAAVPGCVAHIVDGAGHAIAMTEMPAIMTSIRMAGMVT